MRNTFTFIRTFNFSISRLVKWKCLWGRKRRGKTRRVKRFAGKKRSPGNVWPQKTLFMHWSNKKLNRKAFKGFRSSNSWVFPFRPTMLFGPTTQLSSTPQRKPLRCDLLLPMISNLNPSSQSEAVSAIGAAPTGQPARTLRTLMTESRWHWIFHWKNNSS